MRWSEDGGHAVGRVERGYDDGDGHLDPLPIDNPFYEHEPIEVKMDRPTQFAYEAVEKAIVEKFSQSGLEDTYIQCGYVQPADEEWT